MHALLTKERQFVNMAVEFVSKYNAETLVPMKQLLWRKLNELAFFQKPSSREIGGIRGCRGYAHSAVGWVYDAASGCRCAHAGCAAYQ
jgi:hypothetical protein